MMRALVLLLVLSPGCTTMRYLSQAAHGQLLMMQDAEPIDDVLADPATDDRTRRLLGEVPIVQAWAERRGLDAQGNYRTFVQRKGAASVWYVTASKPLAFEPKVWSFPIVGSFPMLGWFALEDALEFRQQLKDDGWEVYVRGAIAYSTGGWFRDPVISTMFLDVPGETGELVNVILHETVHANVLVRDQAYFNESLASFIADGMTAEYLAARFGRNSPELAIYRQDLTDSRARGRILEAGYQELDALYKSTRQPDDYKLRRKQVIMKRLQIQAQLSVEPNNAMLLGFRTYNVGFTELTELLRACGGNWGRFIDQVKRLRPEDFPAPLAEDLGPALRPLVKKRCAR